MTGFTRALAAAVGLAAAMGQSAAAQTTVSGQLPLSPICVQRFGSACPTPVIGTIENILLTPPVFTNVGPGESRVTGTVRTIFSGQLQADGILAERGTLGQYPSFTFGGINDEIRVNVDTQFVTNVDVAAGYAVTQSPEQEVANPGHGYVIENLRVNAIGVNVQAREFTFADGRTGTFSLSTPDPLAIAGNATSVSGSFESTDGRILFGRLDGSVGLLSAPGVVTAPDSNFGTFSYVSPFAVDVTVTPTILTQLDETGLITPTVSVTNGINLNGSTVSNVAAGVAAGDAVNRAQLDAEAAARAARDAQLQTAVSNEASTRSMADTQLQSQIVAEVAARSAADTSLANRVGSVEAALQTIDGRIARVERRIAGATAVATAMSGNAFLPDMKFNLTANVAAYDGAQAGAMQIGALVSRHVALNGGVATGFNRGGKVAARAGITIGW